MRWVLMLGLTGALLAGCAGQTPLIDRVSDGRVAGDAEHVSIQGGRLDALPLAVAHCARFGRSAEWSHADGDRSVYTCVAKP
jgi:hypothetical protein